MTKPLILETRGLTMSFGHQQVIHNLSLHVEEGQIYGFLGRNGAGKSTTIRIILGLLRATGGEVKLLGAEVKGHGRKNLMKVGALVEAPGFYTNLSARDNLRIAQIMRGLPETSIDRALALTGLNDVGSKPVGAFSMGMKQRLGLSWALLGDPKLLILDEPINGLDPAGVREVRDLMKTLRDEEGVTIFLSSHILSEVQQLADRVGIIHRGTLVTEIDGSRFMEADDITVRIRSSQLQDIIALASRLPWVKEVAALPDLSEQAVSARLPKDRAGELNSIINRSGISVDEFAWIQPDLEEYFLNLTGGADDVKAAAC